MPSLEALEERLNATIDLLEAQNAALTDAKAEIDSFYVFWAACLVFLMQVREFALRVSISLRMPLCHLPERNAEVITSPLLLLFCVLIHVRPLSCSAAP
jgi:hypothetical protein